MNTSRSSKRRTTVLAVSVAPETALEFERLAQSEGRNKSELFREMLCVYGQQRELQTFESLQRYGAAQAKHVGVTTEADVERLIQELRSV